MKLREDLVRGIYAYGFETPSPIQKKAIKVFNQINKMFKIVKNRDLIVLIARIK